MLVLVLLLHPVQYTCTAAAAAAVVVVVVAGAAAALLCCDGRCLSASVCVPGPRHLGNLSRFPAPQHFWGLVTPPTRIELPHFLTHGQRHFSYAFAAFPDFSLDIIIFSMFHRVEHCYRAQGQSDHTRYFCRI